MDIGRAFTYITEDAKWITKLVIAAVLAFFTFLLIPIPLLVGYMAGIARNLMNGEKILLPEWGEDIGKLFMDGLYIVIAQLVYTLPFWILMCIGGVISIGSAGLSEVSEDLAAASLFTSFGLIICLAIIWWIFLILVTPALFIQYVRKNEFGALFRFGEIYALTRDNIGDIVITVVVGLAAGLVIGAVNGVLQVIPCLGTILGLVFSAAAGPWLMFAFGHLYGQIAAKSSGGMTKPAM
jgi:hypothetical protein